MMFYPEKDSEKNLKLKIFSIYLWTTVIIKARIIKQKLAKQQSQRQKLAKTETHKDRNSQSGNSQYSAVACLIALHSSSGFLELRSILSPEISLRITTGLTFLEDCDTSDSFPVRGS